VPDWHSRYSKDLLASVKRPELERVLHELLHPETSDQYAVVVGGTGTGKSTAVRLAMRSLLADPKGVVYFLVPELLAAFARAGARGGAPWRTARHGSVPGAGCST
jgi:ABC-type glutathione transport system ATPase component